MASLVQVVGQIRMKLHGMIDELKPLERATRPPYKNGERDHTNLHNTIKEMMQTVEKWLEDLA